MHKIPGEILHDYFKICTFDGETVINNSQSLNIFIKEGFIFQSQYGYRLKVLQSYILFRITFSQVQIVQMQKCFFKSVVKLMFPSTSSFNIGKNE